MPDMAAARSLGGNGVGILELLVEVAGEQQTRCFPARARCWPARASGIPPIIMMVAAKIAATRARRTPSASNGHGSSCETPAAGGNPT